MSIRTGRHRRAAWQQAKRMAACVRDRRLRSEGEPRATSADQRAGENGTLLWQQPLPRLTVRLPLRLLQHLVAHAAPRLLRFLPHP